MNSDIKISKPKISTLSWYEVIAEQVIQLYAIGPAHTNDSLTIGQA